MKRGVKLRALAMARAGKNYLESLVTNENERIFSTSLILVNKSYVNED